MVVLDGIHHSNGDGGIVKKNNQKPFIPSAPILLSLRNAKIAVGICVTVFLICHSLYLHEHGLMERLSSIPTMTSKAIEDSVSKTLAMDLLLLDVNITSRAPTKDNFPSIESTQFSRQLLINYEQIMMGETEINLIVRHMNNVNTYLEWGSGGSTLNFVTFVSGRAVSIEHNAKWCDKMKTSLQQDSKFSHVDYHCVPVRRGSKGWGYFTGFEEGSYKPFKSYIDEIDNAELNSYDMILNDGRARVAASIKALSYLHNNSVMVLHDAERIFDKRRVTRFGYREMLKYYDIVDAVGKQGIQGLAILRRKSKFSNLEGNHAQVQKMLDERYP